MATIISGYVTQKKTGFKLFKSKKEINDESSTSEQGCVKNLLSCFNPTEKRTVILLFKVNSIIMS